MPNDAEQAEQTLRIFISWSGERSRKIAESLRTWLPLVLDGIDLWLSSEDLPKGKRWGTELAQHLECCKFGILVLTPENMTSPWIMFEAGALARDLDEGRVVPYLISLDTNTLEGPLAQFQAVQANRVGTQRLVRDIGIMVRANNSEIHETRFNAFWDRLAKEIEAIKSESFEDNFVNQANLSDNEMLKKQLFNLNEINENHQKQLFELTQMVSQLVSSGPFTASINANNKQEAYKEELAAFTGAWRNPTDGTSLYAQIIDGRLHSPYCYRGNDKLTGIHYGWNKIGDYWYVRFRWFDSNVSGFCLYKSVSKDEFSGAWWYGKEGHQPVDLNAFTERMDGVPLQWIRIPVYDLPTWASEYFYRVKKGAI